MSDLRVEIVKVDEVLPHPNAQRLEIARIAGWECVTGLGQFKAGDLAVYVPVDAILPAPLCAQIFKNSKIVPDKGRIKTIRIRGHVSQGLLLVPRELPGMGWVDRGPDPVGTDVAEVLGITKYEPPEAGSPQSHGLNKTKRKKLTNPNFKEYTKIQNIKWYDKLFTEGETVWMTEKIHGTNFRAGWVLKPKTWYRPLLNFLGFNAYEFVYGSHRVQLQERKYVGWYAKAAGNVYAEAVEKYDLRNKLRPGEVLYGEVYGDGIQKNYKYGCAPGEHKLVVFDICRDGAFVNHSEVIAICCFAGIDVVPVLYDGPFSAAALKAATEGASVLCPDQPIREGCVVRPTAETLTPFGRKVMKSINPDYSLIPEEDQTEFH